MFDLKNRLVSKQSTTSASPSSGNTATNGNDVVFTGYESITLLLRISARTDGTYTPKIQVSADGSNYYDLDADSYIGGAVPGAQNAVGDFLFGVAQIKSAAAVSAGVTDMTTITHVRSVVTQASGTTGATFQTSFLLSHARHAGNAV